MRLAPITLLILGSILPLSLAAETGFEALTVAAEQGDPDSQYQLALSFDPGKDVPQDQAAAAIWHKIHRQ